MELEEAIDILKNGICDYVIPSYCKDCENKTECLDDCNFILAIYTVLQELEHLQKENRKLQTFKDEVKEIRDDYSSFELDDCVNIAIEIDGLLRWE